MKKNKPTVASLFCGIGGLDLGFEWAGFDVIWATDIMPAAIESYPKNFGRPAFEHDVNEMALSLIPDVDVIIGGPPCQSFSLVGQRREDDERGKLVFRFFEAVKFKRPAAFVMENVPGISASKVDGMRLTDVLADEFRKIGYIVNVVKLDASHYLVPQKRKRIFIMGSLSALVPAPDPQLFAKECYKIDNETYNNGAEAALGDLGSPVAKGEFSNYKCKPHSEFSRIMRRAEGKRISLHEIPQMSETDKILLSFIPPGGNYQDVPDAYATQRILNFKRTGGRTTTYARLHPDRPSYTVNTYFRRPNVGSNFHYSASRLITAREALRLQSIPDHFAICKCSQEVRNTLIGNAVPPLMGQAVGWSVLRILNQATCVSARQIEMEMG